MILSLWDNFDSDGDGAREETTVILRIFHFDARQTRLRDSLMEAFLSCLDLVFAL